MNLRRIVAGGTAVIATAGVMLATTTGTAAANDDTRKVSGSCSRSSDYTLQLSDRGSQQRQQRLNYSIDGDRGKGRIWTVSVYKDGNRIYRTTRKTNGKGNIRVIRDFMADDDADIKVFARAGYGERCSRTTSMDGRRTTEKVSGSCSRSSDYTLRLSDRGSQLRQQRLNYSIDGDRGKGRIWTVSVYKDGNRIYRTTRKTNGKGNIRVIRDFMADDDADIKVFARAGYGERCSRIASLD